MENRDSSQEKDVPNSENKASEDYKVYGQRFIVSFVFLLGNISAVSQLSILNPISQQLSVIQEVEPVIINMALLIFLVMNPIAAFPANFIIDTYGIDWSFRIGCVFIILGSGIRLFVDTSFYFVIISSILSGIGSPFIFNGIAKLSTNWQYPEARQKVTTVTAVCFMIFSNLTILITTVTFSGYDAKTEGGDFHNGKQLTKKLFLIMFILSLALLAPSAILIKNKPKTPPSATSALPREPFCFGLKVLFKNRNYIFLCLAFGFTTCVTQGIGPVFSFLLKPFCFNSTDVSIAMLIALFSGIPGAMLSSKVLEKTKKQKFFLILSGSMNMLLLDLLIACLHSRKLTIVCLDIIISAFFSMPMIPLMIEYACEMAYPVGEGTVAGILDTLGKIMGFGMGSLLGLFVKGNSPNETLWGIIALYCALMLGVLFLFFTKEDLRKLQADLKAKENLVPKQA